MLESLEISDLEEVSEMDLLTRHWTLINLRKCFQTASRAPTAHCPIGGATLPGCRKIASLRVSDLQRLF